ncbi:MAG TPA: signal peptide peptidase SppA, partial [Planctomycetes bacterium]|nr:signal peptide peptidase SppA [Planctomycetota bacterium]
FIEQLEALKNEKNLKAVVLDVDSPGGSATMSDVLHHRLGEVQVPKVALLGNIAASGGYYVAASCDKLVSHPTGVTGSIGVIFEAPQVYSLMDKIGVGMFTVKSGDYKDMASPFRAPDEREIILIQRTVDVIFERFVSVVAQGRNMKVDDVKAVADGRILVGTDALAAGLIDAIGYEEDAIAEAEKLAGVSNATIVRYGTSPGILGLLGLQARTQPLHEIADAMYVRGPMFLYRGPMK